MRPHQWLKNLICFAGLLFSENDLSRETVLANFKIFISFCMISSAVYILNDTVDRKKDALHPTKRNRPIACGKISIISSLILIIILVISSIFFSLGDEFKPLTCVFIYFLVNLIYSFVLKDIFVIDVLCISIGFILRLIAGVFSINDTPTLWVIICTFFLTSFIGFSKRYSELLKYKNNSFLQRPVLVSYTESLLSDYLKLTSTLTVISYTMFTIVSNKNQTLVVTVPIVLYGLMYYDKILKTTNMCEEPEKLIYKCYPLFLCILCWLITFLVIFNYNLRIF
jgi:4-hydroxybenzoate polyprenyltransferase